MFAEFKYIFQWWMIIFIIGLIFLPISIKMFNKFFDRGYIFSKTLGIAISSYIIWLFSSMKLVKFERISIIVSLTLSFLVILFLFKKYLKIKKLKMMIKENNIVLKMFAVEEGIFLATLSFWAFLRGCKPGIEGLEKFMDWGFVNTILRTEYMPPVDMWFAGKSINYYYYGQYVSAFLTKLCNIDSAICYNLMMSTLFAFSFSLCFSLSANLVHIFGYKKTFHKIKAGIVSGFLIGFGSNLHTIFFTLIFPQLKNMGIKFANIKVNEDYWFPDATRFIGYNPDTKLDYTIHEFPAYSFIVSDLHAHVINLIFVLTVIAIIFSYILNIKDLKKESNIYKSGVSFPIEILIIGFFIGIFQMTNYWDFPIYTTVALFAIIYVNFFQNKDKSISYSYTKTATEIVCIIILSILTALPFKLNFQMIANKIMFTHTHTELYQLFIVWGHQLIICVYFMFFLYFTHTNDNSAIKRLKTKDGINIDTKGKFGIRGKIHKIILEINSSDLFSVILIISAIGLIIVPEILYVKDIYGPPYHRANTMFKLTYQSFSMFCIVIGFIYVRIFAKERKTIKYIFLKICIFYLIVCPLLYPFLSIPKWYVGNYETLDGGIKKIAANFRDKDGEALLSDDIGIVEWFNKNAKGQPVIVEADGDSYTGYCCISVATGLPTIQGWIGHEWLWRNNNNEINKEIYERVEHVKTIYESDEIEDTKILLKKFNVKYIVVSKAERKKFINLKENKLLNLGSMVYSTPDSKIIEVKF